MPRHVPFGLGPNFPRRSTFRWSLKPGHTPTPSFDRTDGHWRSYALGVGTPLRAVVSFTPRGGATRRRVFAPPLSFERRVDRSLSGLHRCHRTGITPRVSCTDELGCPHLFGGSGDRASASNWERCGDNRGRHDRRLQIHFFCFQRQVPLVSVHSTSRSLRDVGALGTRRVTRFGGPAELIAGCSPTTLQRAYL